MVKQAKERNINSEQRFNSEKARRWLKDTGLVQIKQQQCLSASPIGIQVQSWSPLASLSSPFLCSKMLSSTLFQNEPSLTSPTYKRHHNNGHASSLANLHFQYLPKSYTLFKTVSSIRSHNYVTFIFTPVTTHSSPLSWYFLSYKCHQFKVDKFILQSSFMSLSLLLQEVLIDFPILQANTILEFKIHNLQFFIIQVHTSLLLGSHVNTTSPTR